MPACAESGSAGSVSAQDGWSALDRAAAGGVGYPQTWCLPALSLAVALPQDCGREGLNRTAGVFGGITSVTGRFVDRQGARLTCAVSGANITRDVVQYHRFARGGVHFELGKTDVVRQGFALRLVTVWEDLADTEHQRCGLRDLQHRLGADIGGGARAWSLLLGTGQLCLGSIIRWHPRPNPESTCTPRRMVNGYLLGSEHS